MIQPEYAPLLISSRHKYLRSLGVESIVVKDVPRRSVRQATGRLLVRFGEWLEGRYPDFTVERSAPMSVSAR